MKSKDILDCLRSAGYNIYMRGNRDCCYYELIAIIKLIKKNQTKNELSEELSLLEKLFK